MNKNPKAIWWAATLACGVVIAAASCFHMRDAVKDNIRLKASAIHAADHPDVGDLAPEFALTNLRGKSTRLSALRGRSVDLAFFCGCDRCKAAATQISKLQKTGHLTSLVSVVSLDRPAAKRFQSESGLMGDIVPDPSDRVAEQYHSVFCPRIWVISSSGVIRLRSSTGLETSSLKSCLAEIITKRI